MKVLRYDIVVRQVRQSWEALQRLRKSQSEEEVEEEKKKEMNPKLHH